MKHILLDKAEHNKPTHQNVPPYNPFQLGSIKVKGFIVSFIMI